MFVKGFGEHIIDILTVNPAIAEVESASAILDVSNYTFQAVTFGKDAQGFKYHAHTIKSTESSTYNEGKLKVTVLNTISPSSYHSSATHSEYNSTYNSVPNYPHYYDTRLERSSTITNCSSTLDLGHYANPARSTNSSVSSLWNVEGGFPPSTTSEYVLLSSNGSVITSGTLPAGYFNTHDIMDPSGFLKFIELNASAASSISSTTLDSTRWASGAYLVAPEVSSGQVRIHITVHGSDLASLAAFGGLNHFGFWCFDMRKMLDKSLTPPYGWDAINNVREYKLVAKKTYWKDLLHHSDYSTSAGFESYLINAGTNIDSINEGPEYIFNINLA
jgi:hypothetical protein